MWHHCSRGSLLSLPIIDRLLFHLRKGLPLLGQPSVPLLPDPKADGQDLGLILDQALGLILDQVQLVGQRIMIQCRSHNQRTNVHRNRNPLNLQSLHPSLHPSLPLLQHHQAKVPRLSMRWVSAQLRKMKNA